MIQKKEENGEKYATATTPSSKECTKDHQGMLYWPLTMIATPFCRYFLSNPRADSVGSENEGGLGSCSKVAHIALPAHKRC